VKGVRQLDDGIDGTFGWESKFPSLIDLQTNCVKVTCLRHETLRSMRKYGQYHHPIAQPIFFWLNGRAIGAKVRARERDSETPYL
jgi:hypothetical protein